MCQQNSMNRLEERKTHLIPFENEGGKKSHSLFLPSPFFLLSTKNTSFWVRGEKGNRWWGHDGSQNEKKRKDGLAMIRKKKKKKMKESVDSSAVSLHLPLCCLTEEEKKRTWNFGTLFQQGLISHYSSLSLSPGAAAIILSKKKSVNVSEAQCSRKNCRAEEELKDRKTTSGLEAQGFEESLPQSGSVLATLLKSYPAFASNYKIQLFFFSFSTKQAFADRKRERGKKTRIASQAPRLQIVSLYVNATSATVVQLHTICRCCCCCSHSRSPTTLSLSADTCISHDPEVFCACSLIARTWM